MRPDLGQFLTRTFKTIEQHRVALFVILSLVPIGLAFGYTGQYGVTVAWWDDFDGRIPLFQKYFAHQLEWQDFFRQHNEHRIVFPRMVFLLLGLLTKMSNRVELFLIVILFLGNFVLIFLEFQRRADWKQRILWLLPVLFMVLNQRQGETLLWSFTLSLVMTLSFVLAAFFALHQLNRPLTRRRRRCFAVLSVACATGASFSAAMGLLVWPILVVQLLLSSAEKGEKGSLLRWLLVIGVVEWIIYFHGYVQPAYHPSTMFIFLHPIQFASYFFTCLGGVLLPKETALPTGIVAVTLFGISAWFLRREKAYAENGFYVSVALYSLATAFMVSVGRAGSGSEQALASRYTSFTLYFYIAVYLLLLEVVLRKRHALLWVGLGAVLAVMTLSTAMAYGQGGQAGLDYQTSRERMAYYLTHYRLVSDDDLRMLFADVRQVRAGADFLEKRQLNAFAVKAPELATLAPLDIEPLTVIDRNSFKITDRAVWIESWAVDPKWKGAGGGMWVKVNGELYAALYGIARPDVAQYLGGSDYEFSGFLAIVPRSVLKPGENQVEVYLLSHDKKGYFRHAFTYRWPE
jgi:hypothetical protein